MFINSWYLSFNAAHLSGSFIELKLELQESALHAAYFDKYSLNELLLNIQNLAIGAIMTTSVVLNLFIKYFSRSLIYISIGCQNV